MRPLVSVIIPVFNRASELANALRTVSDQSFSDWEAVVVDDCSSEDMASVASGALPPERLRFVRHEVNRGSGAARNSGIFAATGRYVAFLDSDDTWHPEKLKRQVELVERDPDPELVFCVTQTRVMRDGKLVRIAPRRGVASGENWSEFLYLANGFAQTSSFFLSRELATRTLFNPEIHRQEDHLFFLRAGGLGARYRLVEEPLTTWNNDQRFDRVSLSPRLEMSRRFIADAGDLITDKARIAFEARSLGPMMLRERPVETLKLFGRAAAIGAVTPRDLMAVAARTLLPPAAVVSLQRLLGV